MNIDTITKSTPTTVKQLSLDIKKNLESEFKEIQLYAEIYQYAHHSSSRHAYITLKEDEFVLDAVCWRGTRTIDTIKQGTVMLLTGKITTYPGKSRYQFVIQNAQLNEEGTLLQQIENLKQTLIAEGLCDSSKKRLMPSAISRIGIITSRSGAVIEDMRIQFEKCYPVELLLSPASVQGDLAVNEIINAMNGLINANVDVIIIARGGGSAEDLAAFNKEELVRAVATCPIPTVSAIGHETDITLCDLVADLRAPTPTSAPSMILPLKVDLIRAIQNISNQSAQCISSFLDIQKTYLNHARQVYNSIDAICSLHIQSLDYRQEQLYEKAISKLKKLLPTIVAPQIKSDWINAIASQMISPECLLYKLHSNHKETLVQLELIDPKNILNRGFCMACDTDKQKYCTSSVMCAKAESVSLVFSDGEIVVNISNK